MEALIGIFVVFFLIGVIYALRHAIAHLILTVIAVSLIVYFLDAPEQNGWWSLIGIFIIVGQLAMAKESLIDKPAAKRKAMKSAMKRQEAEDYIMSSGDPEAIKMLMLARANPANYNQILAGGMNKGNDTLKTALGVMTGVVAGNLITNAITAATISSALENMQLELNYPDHDSLASSYVDADSGGDVDSWDI